MPVAIQRANGNQTVGIRGGIGEGGKDKNDKKDKVVVAAKSDNKLSKKPSTNLKRIFHKALVQNTAIKGFFRSKSGPLTPIHIVSEATSLLASLDSFDDNGGAKSFEKMPELKNLIAKMKLILYGTSDVEPSFEACSKLTQQIFKDKTFRLLVLCLPKLDLEARKDATQVAANLQRQPVCSRLIASDYLEANLDLIDPMIVGYEDPMIALHYGAMLRECIRHQVVAKYVLKPEHIKNFFDYIQLPNFDVAADATSTFKELMTRHKSTVTEFLSEHFVWFFDEFNSKLLESSNYITRRQAIKLLGDILLARSNANVMVRYVNSKDNLRISMNLLRETSKNIQIDAFHVFKLFVANQNKRQEIINILVANKSKLLRFLHGFKIDKDDDELFEADKSQIIKEIEELESLTSSTFSGELQKL